MNLRLNLPKIVLIALALFITVLISQIIPEQQFAPYTIQLDSVWNKEPADQHYFIDFDNDTIPELLKHCKINQPGHLLEYGEGKHTRLAHRFKHKEYFVSKSLTFADVDQNGVKDILFVTVIDQLAFLNIITYRMDDRQSLARCKETMIAVDSVKYRNNLPDLVNPSMVVSDQVVWFNLHSGYSVRPRKVYRYDFKTQEILQTEKNSINIEQIKLKNSSGKNLLLASKVIASSNTITHDVAEMLRSSKHPDTLAFYEELKNFVFDYGDFSSYILLYDNNLKFAFEPIPSTGWTNYNLTDFIEINDTTCLVSLTNTQQGDTAIRSVGIYTLDGKQKQKSGLADNAEELFVQGNRVVFHTKRDLLLYSNLLVPEKTITGITYAAGFFDINGDSRHEFIGFNENNLIIFSPDFSREVQFDIFQEFRPYPENGTISLLRYSNKNCFMFNSRLFYYIFSYNRNRLAVAKYPFYTVLFLLTYILLYWLLKLNTRRLEQEKLRLEQIVVERTLELKTSNEQLALKNQEIERKAEELKQINQHLSLLDQFKRILISTLVHDLKNPLSHIMVSTSEKGIRHTAARMLSLVTNLLDVEKCESTTLVADKQLVPLDPLINQVVADQEISLVEKNITAALRSHQPRVMADPELLSRVFENLLTNAIRHSPLNSTIQITVSSEPDGKVGIRVANTGSHIPAEALNTIFDKFVQATKSTSSGYRTTGLGLTFCRMVVEAHGHTITAANTPEGVEFYFTLDGDSSGQESQQTLTTSQNQLLSDSDRQLLQPWLSQLQPLEAYMISDIRRIAATMPVHTPDLLAFRDLLLNAAFASNDEQFRRMVEGDQ